jgi:Tfp pilus assembly protein PilE
MKSDLRNLITAQEAYFSDNNSTYAQSTTNLGTNYKASSGITVTLSNVTNTGWQASATSVSTAKTCAITLGGGSTNEGDPICQ